VQADYIAYNIYWILCVYVWVTRFSMDPLMLPYETTRFSEKRLKSSRAPPLMSSIGIERDWPQLDALNGSKPNRTPLVGYYFIQKKVKVVGIYIYIFYPHSRHDES
jgi:hypothetical protein